MDGMIDKLLEALKDKISKKQVIAIVGMVLLHQLTAHPGYITGIALVAILAQTLLDRKISVDKPPASATLTPDDTK